MSARSRHRPLATKVRTPFAAEVPASQPGLRKHEPTADRFVSAPGLNDRSFALANRSLALAPASGKPKGENYRTQYDQHFSHWTIPSETARIGIVIIPGFITSAERPHIPNNTAPFR